MTIFCPPNYQAPVSAAALNQFELPGTFTPPAVWAVDPVFGSFIDSSGGPGDSLNKIFVATTDAARAGQSTEFSVTVQTENGPVVFAGHIQMSFPEAPVTHLVVTAGSPVLSA